VTDRAATRHRQRPWFPARFPLDGWTLSAIAITTLVAIPLITIVSGLFVPASENWPHIRDTVLRGYIFNTATLSFLACLLSLLFGVPTAWLVATCEFPCRRFFEWALILPLAIPTYIAAYAYSETQEQMIPVMVFLREHMGAEAMQLVEQVFVYGLLATILAAVLFPYVYLAARASFTRQAGAAALEAARVLGSSSWISFRRIALPMARPAIVGGLILVFMEVVNDYGAVHYFNIPTLTTGIFRAWLSKGDPGLAVRLSGGVLVLVLVLVYLERRNRGRASYGDKAVNPGKFRRKRLPARKAFSAMLCCIIPLAVGFIFPVVRLTVWAAGSSVKIPAGEFGRLLLHSISLAAGTAVLLVIAAITLSYAAQLRRNVLTSGILKIALLGYAVPGAVIAVGVLVPAGWVDRIWGEQLFGGTLLLLVLAYFGRFLAVAVAPVESAMTRLCGQLTEASRTLGHRPLPTLLRINIPALRPTLLAAMILVFVDLLKELPLTLILRPFNFETLATKALGYAEEGRIPETSIPALVIIATGALVAVSLNRFFRTE